MRVTFHAVQPFAPLGLEPGYRVTVSDEHPGEFEIRYRIPANYGLVLGALLGGELVDEVKDRRAEEIRELIRLVAGLPIPRPERVDRPLRLVGE
jgi:hypothetical protein